MPVYIVCRRKRNNPRMDVRICEMKCNLKEDCSEFKTHEKNAQSEKSALTASGDDPVRLEAA